MEDGLLVRLENIPKYRTPIQYDGSNHGPGFTLKKASTFAVSVECASEKSPEGSVAVLGAWCKSNALQRNHGHG